MKELLQNLVKLQSLQLSENRGPNLKEVLAELRAKIPAQILGHYDRLAARGKKGVAAVHGQVCTGCHMQVPLGVVMTLRHEEDIQLCENCGRYLYLPPAPPTAVAEPAAGPKPERKSPKPKKSLQVV
jgi:predicted  nucleic acid-binding Zn-ribbon protein